MTLNIQVPDSLHNAVQEISKKDNFSAEQFINSAIAEKISAFLEDDYLEEKGKKGSFDEFISVLDKAPNVEPDDYDKM